MVRSLCHFRACLVLMLLISYSSGNAQTTACTDLKNGVFIFFSQKNGTKSTYTRNGSVQKEQDASTHETVMWDVEWKDDCSYYLKYNSGFEDKPREVMEFLKKHRYLVHITSVTDDYYSFESYVDNLSGPVYLKDIFWIKQRRDGKNKTVSNPRIDSLLAIRKIAFDSAIKNSAILYVFRPGKFTMSAVSYMLYLNDVPICDMANKAAYIVRIMKEGQTTLFARINKQETSVTFDVKYGNNYYLRCELPWSLSPKPKLTMVHKNEAETYFDHIK